ncbi:MAG: VCBS repeat-containing protein, partial [Myxococcaceae bacterium]|nr:VCBS repeat-containing protein [Myxococcaceae bacterium]
MAQFFTEVSAEVGLEGKLARRVAWGDVNGDGYPDFIGIETGVRRGLQHLYLNRGGVRFEEVTEASGLTANRAGTAEGQTALMVVFGDVDGDGDLDVFSGSYSQEPSGAKYTADSNELYLNDGAGRFTLARESGLDRPWPLTTAAAAFTDYDKDGKLDLYVGNFMVSYPAYDAYPSNLYRGDGAGHFTLSNEVAHLTLEAALGDPSGMFVKPTYGVTACDVNDDGWPDLLASTYALSWDDLWLNGGDGTFRNAARELDFHMDAVPHPSEPEFRHGGNTFSSSCADYDNDGDLDVFQAETAHGDWPRSTADRSRILKNSGREGGWVFERPELAETGIARELNGTGPDGDFGNEGDHGASWADLDNDGLLDLVIENSAYPNSHAWVFQQRADHTFVNVTEESGVRPLLVNSNGISIDDYDRDGDLDLLMGSVNTGSQSAPGGVEQIHLFRNE